MLPSVQLRVSVAGPMMQAAPQAQAAAGAAPTIAAVLDASDGSGQFGLYQLDDGRVAIAAASLADGASLPDDGLVLMNGGKAWAPGKAVPAALVSDETGFRILTRTGEGTKAKFGSQAFDAAGNVSGKAVSLSFAAALDSEIEAGQDLNGDNVLGDAVSRVADSTDDAHGIGLYVLTSGKIVIDEEAKATGTLAGNSSVTLTANGKNWSPGKMEALAVRATDDGYEVLLRSGSGAKAKYLYQSFDAKGVAVDKAQKMTADVLLDRELLYGQDLNGDTHRGNVVRAILDPAAPLAKNQVAASSYARSATAGGEVYLGGRFIELGISAWGNFGTVGNKPPGFYGANSSSIGMSADHDGYGTGFNLPVDYFLPGAPEERFAVGYQANGTTSTNSNSALNGAQNMATTVEDTSSGRTLSAVATSTWSAQGAAVMSVRQQISFDAEALWFKNVVTVTNETGSDWTSARYMRSFDPDNTVSQNGDYSTRNTVIGTVASDGYAAVKAETYDPNDPLFLAFGSRSPIMFFSMNANAVASTFGFANEDPYAADAYSAPAARNQAIDADQAITLTWDAGSLKSGASASFEYFTSLDNRVTDSIISEISGVGLYKLESGDFAVAKSPVTVGDLPQDNVILKSGAKSWAPKGGAPIAVKANSEGYQVTYKTGSGAKTAYYLQAFDLDGQAVDKAEKLTTAKLVNLEADFEQDLNGDTMLGNKIAAVIDPSDPAGQAGLYKVAAGNLWLSSQNLTPGSDLAAGAVQLTAKGKSWGSAKETPLAVRVNDSGLYELMVRSGTPSTPKFTEYTIDQSGAFSGKGRTVKNAELGARETLYAQDLNGNGTIGV